MVKYVYLVHVIVQVLTGQSPGLLPALGGGLILLGVLSLAHEDNIGCWALEVARTVKLALRAITGRRRDGEYSRLD